MLPLYCMMRSYAYEFGYFRLLFDQMFKSERQMDFHRHLTDAQRPISLSTAATFAIITSLRKTKIWLEAKPVRILECIARFNVVTFHKFSRWALFNSQACSVTCCICPRSIISETRFIFDACFSLSRNGHFRLLLQFNNTDKCYDISCGAM